MEHSSEYLGLLVVLVTAATIAGLILLLNSLLGPKRKPSAEKLEPFECGVEAVGETSPQITVKFYLMAMLFILFDVEIVWFFPWAVNLKGLGWYGIVVMFGFIAVLALGFGYAWKKGALEWEK